ncbi:MAG: hypothetical protein R3220_13145, partial [Balneolaceae bacterium]|nr:hypothetical protein [Balneolaceae bacterium]
AIVLVFLRDNRSFRDIIFRKSNDNDRAWFNKKSISNFFNDFQRLQSLPSQRVHTVQLGFI